MNIIERTNGKNEEKDVINTIVNLIVSGFNLICVTEWTLITVTVWSQKQQVIKKERYVAESGL